MTDESSFPDQFDARLYGHRGGSAVWQVNHYFRYVHRDHPTITVPCGSLTDGASIPRVFHGVLGPSGPYFRAAVIHDYLYSRSSDRWHSGVKRAMADSIFLDAMIDCGVGFLTRRTIYRAVRLFGWACYKKEDKKPIKRIICDHP